ncbi:MAG: exodeoxyribonuclease VII large subunit [Bacteroidales bacterium]|nr:exodeoxyribonuclease VII large subunit [Bacteroidales bacterium]
MERKFYTLSQLSLIIKETFYTVFNTAIWIKAEINELYEHSNRNCYLELIEKDVIKDKIIAKFRAIIWGDRYYFLKKNFENVTGVSFGIGLSVLLKVNVEYNELYGVTLIVLDIDPSYTLGEWEQRRIEILRRLEKEGVISLNKELKIPDVTQNIALISSKIAAGCQDFIKHLLNNPYKFKYNITFYEASMQGEGVEKSIIDILDKIANKNYDVVVIARGGGSKADLAAFDSYRLAYHVCQFPIPIISAIGHERDYTVIDYVANTRAKTPTDAAAIIIEKTLNYWLSCTRFCEKIINYSQEIIYNQINKFSFFSNSILKSKSIIDKHILKIKNLSYSLKYTTKFIVNEQSSNFTNLSNKLSNATKTFFHTNNIALENNIKSLKKNLVNLFMLLNNKVVNYEKIINSHNPINVLRKGYTITYKNKKIIKSKSNLTQDDIITTKFYDGEVSSKII